MTLQIQQIKSTVDQKGVGLVEMMVVMLLGLVMIGGVSSLYLNFKQSFQLQKSQANLLDSMRYSGTMMSGILRQAGYASLMVNGTLLSDKSTVFLQNDAGAGNFTEINQVVFGEESTVSNVTQYLEDGSTQTIASLPNDSVSIRFLGGNEIFRCLGSGANDTGTLYSATFRLNSDFQLECEDEIIAGATLETDTDALLGENTGRITNQTRVLGLRALYGVDLTGDDSVDQYLTAANVADWTQIRSLTLRLTVQAGNLAPTNLFYVVHLPNTPLSA